MSQPAIVLVEPQLAENIGMAARAMLNFGLTELRLVNPRPEWPNEKARTSSAGADEVLFQAKVFRSVAEAIADLQLVLATSGRNRELVKVTMTPRHAAAELRARADLKAGLLFGPERTGLVNDDIALATAVVTVPTNPAFGSLNLAQAVLLLAYEWHQAADATPPVELRRNQSPPAVQRHVLSFYERFEHELDQCGFLRPPEKRAAMVRNLRALFSRAELSDQELRTLHGVITELVTRRTG